MYVLAIFGQTRHDSLIGISRNNFEMQSKIEILCSRLRPIDTAGCHVHPRSAKLRWMRTIEVRDASVDR